MKVLITGGGRVHRLPSRRALLAEGHEVLAIDNFATGRRDNLADRDDVDAGRGLDRGARGARPRRSTDFGPDAVAHAAASYKDPDAWAEDARTNALGTANVVEAAKAAGIDRIVYFQTALCYGTMPLEKPITLEHPIRPDSSYAISKTGGEQYIQLSGIPYVSFRLANVYGPRNLSGPLPTFFQRLTEGKPCFVMDTRRDFVYVDDLLEVVIAALNGTGQGVYHVSSGSDYSIKELFDAVVEAMGIELDEEVEVRPRPEEDAPSILLDPSRTEPTSTGRRTSPLSTGVAEAVDWYRENGIGETYTHLQGGGAEGPGVTRGRRQQRPGRRGRGLRRIEPGAATARARRRTACSWSTTCSRPSGRTCPTTPRRRAWSRARSPTTRCSAELPADLDYVFHLATYHGNQSSMADPLADHENNTLTTLKLFEAIKDLDGLRRVVYASAGCTVAEKTFEEAEATQEDAPVSLYLDSPYQISKIIGELYGELLLHAPRPAGGEGALPERLRAGRGARRRPLARHGQHGVAQRHADVHLQGAQDEALPVENGGHRDPRLHLRRRHRPRPARLRRLHGEPGEVYNLASGSETSILELAELINELTENPTPIALTPARDWDHSGQRFGSTEKARAELGFECEVELRDGLERTIAWTRDNLSRVERTIAKHRQRMDELAPAPAT